MQRIIASTVAIAAFCLPLRADLARAGADGSAPPAIAVAVADFDYVDTSGEARDQTDEHAKRLDAFMLALRRDLAASGRFRVVAAACRPNPCLAGRSTLAELQNAAREAGAKLLLTGAIHKMSTLVQWAKVSAVDVETNAVVSDKLVTFRGDSDEAWKRAETFIASEIVETPPALSASAGPEISSSPVKLAVFDFELEDFSGGAGLIPMSADDIAQLAAVTDTVRRLIAQSERYNLVDVGSADAEPAKAHSLRNCDGCDAGIALHLGAEQSLVGIVTRITRTDYAVTFKIRDARTGGLIAVEQTDLRIGASYSWSRGAARLIKDRLLEKQPQP